MNINSGYNRANIRQISTASYISIHTLQVGQLEIDKIYLLHMIIAEPNDYLLLFHPGLVSSCLLF